MLMEIFKLMINRLERELKELTMELELIKNQGLDVQEANKQKYREKIKRRNDILDELIKD